MKYTIGFIGAGNMGSALCAAACTGAGPGRVAVTNRTPEKALALAERLDCAVLPDNCALARDCEFVVLAVKPQNIFDVVREIAPCLWSRQTLVSMAAGVTTASLAALIPESVSVVRIMPNTPCAIGKGVVLVSSDDSAAAARVTELLAAAGRLVSIDEGDMDAGCTASGCSPAYAYMFIDAIARGAEAEGLEYTQALELAAGAVMGAAAMVLDSGETPEILRQRVCSKGGSTIEGVNALLDAGLDGTVRRAVAASTRRNRELGKN